MPSPLNLCKHLEMADVFTASKRSDIMRRIKSKGNRSTELRLANLLRKAGVTGWRRHPAIKGNPDFVFSNYRVIVFVDGDFWHGNPRTFKPPKTNTFFWEEKIRYNRANDKRVTRHLRRKGWSVIRIWESALRKHPEACLARVRRAIQKK